jgi:hypothetical protein
MQSSYANGGATNTKVTQPLRLNVVILQGKRENTMHYILDSLGSWRNVYAPVVDIDALVGVVENQKSEKRQRQRALWMGIFDSLPSVIVRSLCH